MNASGGLLAANTSQRTNQFYGNSKGSGYAAGNAGNEIKETEYVSEHHLPIRFGLSVNYQLTPFLALHSGISYTYLFSEFSIPLEKNINFDQKLHYLGIPLGVTWQLWSANRFRFYVSGGMMLEKCISAERDGSSLEHYYKEHPWTPSLEFGLRIHLNK